MGNEIIYFLCYPRGNKKQITVIDLQYNMSYERDDWSCVTPHDYLDRDEAICAARYLASKYNLEYLMFESRYDSEQNEYLGEFE
jgi:hypothetical protein